MYHLGGPRLGPGGPPRLGPGGPPLFGGPLFFWTATRRAASLRTWRTTALWRATRSATWRAASLRTWRATALWRTTWDHLLEGHLGPPEGHRRPLEADRHLVGRLAYGPGGPPLLEGPGGPPLDGPGGPPLAGGAPTGSSSSSSNIAPQCGHSLSDSFTRPSQTSQANISSSLSSSCGAEPSLPILSTAPSFDLNKLMSTIASKPFQSNFG